MKLDTYTNRHVDAHEGPRLRLYIPHRTTRRPPYPIRPNQTDPPAAFMLKADSAIEAMAAAPSPIM